MLSILIPAYNFDTSPLVEALQKQVEYLDVATEIIIFDDHSDNCVVQNRKVAEKFNLKYNYLAQNIGRSKIRNLLAAHAKFEYILFLDGDVVPKSDSFLKNYITAISPDTEVIYGGRKHLENEADKGKLRWKYGFYREDKKPEKRQKEPYLSIITNNLLIQKYLFESIQFEESLATYGCEDVLFGFELSAIQANVQHIENPVIHKDIDNNLTFLNKTKQAWKNFIYLEDKKLLPQDFRPIQRWYLQLKKLKLMGFCLWTFQTFNPALTKNLTGKSPSLFWFDVYRMLYFCHLKESKSIENA